MGPLASYRYRRPDGRETLSDTGIEKGPSAGDGPFENWVVSARSLDRVDRFDTVRGVGPAEVDQRIVAAAAVDVVDAGVSCEGVAAAFAVGISLGVHDIVGAAGVGVEVDQIVAA